MNSKFKLINILSILFLVAACGDSGSATKTGGDNKDEKAAAVIAPVYLSFLEYCNQSETLSAGDPLRITIDYLKASYGGSKKDCENTYANLANENFINFKAGSHISDLRPLAHLKQIETMIADGQIISDIRPLAGLTGLDYLSLSENQISDLSPLSNLSKLKTLHLFNNLITDISPLQNLTRLETLALLKNNIQNIEKLKGLLKLKTLYLGDNPIPRGSINDLEKALPGAVISFY